MFRMQSHTLCAARFLSAAARMAAFAAVTAGFCALGMQAAPQEHKLPAGPGKEVTQRICSACHGVEIVMDRGLTKQAWTQVVSDMVDRGAQGTDEELTQVVDYLAKNFPPKSGAADKSANHDADHSK